MYLETRKWWLNPQGLSKAKRGRRQTIVRDLQSFRAGTGLGRHPVDLLILKKNKKKSGEATLYLRPHSTSTWRTSLSTLDISIYLSCFSLFHMLLSASPASLVGAHRNFSHLGSYPLDLLWFLQDPPKVSAAQNFWMNEPLAGGCCLTPVTKVGKDSPLACAHGFAFPPVMPLLPWSHLLTTSERPVNKQGQKLELVEKASK